MYVCGSRALELRAAVAPGMWPHTFSKLSHIHAPQMQNSIVILMCNNIVKSENLALPWVG